MTQRRVLFVAEAVSIAHVARPSVLASALEPLPFDIHFASSGAFAFCHAGRPWSFHSLHSIGPALFLQRLAKGQPLYSRADWERYVEADLALLEHVRPELVVGDFRLSLAVSARLAKVRYAAICNAHWSPWAVDCSAPPAPDLAVGRLLGATLFEPVFRWSWPLANRFHLVAANSQRRKHGMRGYRSLRELYADGDEVLYADDPALVPTAGAPASHRHLGPIVWSPDLPRPAWWPEAEAAQRPLAYVTLGSTGAAERLPQIVAACREAGLRCLVATAGRADAGAQAGAYQAGVWRADFLPGSAAAELADIVVCNGGSATAHQALAMGRPVLGVCSNIDQLLTMRTIESAGAGAWLRASAATPSALVPMIGGLLEAPARAAAASIQASFSRLDAGASFVRSLL